MPREGCGGTGQDALQRVAEKADPRAGPAAAPQNPPSAPLRRRQLRPRAAGALSRASPLSLRPANTKGTKANASAPLPGGFPLQLRAPYSASGPAGEGRKKTRTNLYVSVEDDWLLRQ